MVTGPNVQPPPANIAMQMQSNSRRRGEAQWTSGPPGPTSDWLRAGDFHNLRQVPCVVRDEAVDPPRRDHLSRMQRVNGRSFNTNSVRIEWLTRQPTIPASKDIDDEGEGGVYEACRSATKVKYTTTPRTLRAVS